MGMLVNHLTLESTAGDAGQGRPAWPEPVDLGFVVGAIRAHAPDLSGDLDEAITVWLDRSAEEPADDQEAALATRRSRLRAFRELLNLSPYQPDPRD
jgi:hypothetical protein